jgi:hypothetical protein
MKNGPYIHLVGELHFSGFPRDPRGKEFEDESARKNKGITANAATP